MSPCVLWLRFLNGRRDAIRFAMFDVDDCELLASEHSLALDVDLTVRILLLLLTVFIVFELSTPLNVRGDEADEEDE